MTVNHDQIKSMNSTKTLNKQNHRNDLALFVQYKTQQTIIT